MENIFAPFEQALRVKKLGFNKECLACYRGGSLYGSGGVSRYFDEGSWDLEVNSEIDGDQWVAALTWEQMKDFLMEKGWYFELIPHKESDVWSAITYPLNNISKTDYIGKFRSKNEARLACVDNLIEKIER